MPNTATETASPVKKPESADPVETSRMSFGDHLDELRGCLIRGLLGVMLCVIVALIFGKEILEFIYRPLLIVQHANGLPPRLLALAPTAGFTAYLKIGFLTGLIVSMPWLITQIWKFIATGLYKNERRFVNRLFPASLLLFVAGVAFLYYVVLPIVLHFFITFNQTFDTPDLTPSFVQQLLLPDNTVTATEPTTTDLPVIPIVSEDPTDAKPGESWINDSTRRWVVQTRDGTMSIPLEQGSRATTMRSEFAIDFYVSFVLMLALAFGIAFETPIVVFFLAWSGVVTRAAMARGRRYVLLGTVIFSAMLTPPDVISQLLLAVPMYLLFELGMLVARLVEKKDVATASG